MSEEKKKQDRRVKCRNCGNLFPYRKGKFYCNTTCRVQHYYKRQSGVEGQLEIHEQRLNEHEQRIGALEGK